MSDIGIYTTLDTILHKLGGGYWWFKASFPKVEVGDRCWVAFQGRWRGYFVVAEVSPPNVILEEWIEMLGGKRRPFQGFTYKVPGVAE